MQIFRTDVFGSTLCYRYFGDKFNFPFHWMMTCIKNEDLIVQLFRTQVSGAAVSAWETICAPGSSSFSQRLSSFNFVTS